jgi:hypothetical protein
MKARILLLCCLGLVAIVSLGVAQEDWNITGAGARAEGFGGAFIGLADDATAISWNPSGLGQLERVELSLVGRVILEEYINELKFKNSLYTKYDTTITKSQSHFTYNFASIAFPIHVGSINIVPAVAFQKQLDNFNREDDATSSYEANGGVFTLTPGIGIKLHPMFYVGGTVNIWMGSLDNTTVYNKVTKDVKANEGTASGLNFTAGILVDFEGMKNPIPIKLGATVKTPFELKVDGNYNYSYAGTITQKGGYVNTVEMPLMYGFGVSGRLGENLTVALDFESRLYGDKKIFRVADGSTPTAAKNRDTLQMSDSKSDINQVRVGAEYLMVTKAFVIPIRVGFRTVPTLRANVDSVTAKYSNTSIVSGNTFTFGTGFIFRQIALDVTYSLSKWEQTYALTDEAATFNLSYTNKINYTSHTISASLIVYF